MCKTAGAALSVTSKLVQNIVVDGDTWTVSTVTPMGERNFSFKLGEDFETKTLDGRSIMVILSRVHYILILYTISLSEVMATVIYSS